MNDHKMVGVDDRRGHIMLKIPGSSFHVVSAALHRLARKEGDLLQ